MNVQDENNKSRYHMYLYIYIDTCTNFGSLDVVVGSHGNATLLHDMFAYCEAPHC